MNARRDKAKQQNSQINKQLETVKPAAKQQGHWKENLGKYFIDISKYIVTGVVIASLFQDVSDRDLIYGLGIVLSLSTLSTGLVLTNKKTEDK